MYIISIAKFLILFFLEKSTCNKYTYFISFSILLHFSYHPLLFREGEGTKGKKYLHRLITILWKYNKLINARFISTICNAREISIDTENESISNKKFF